METRIDRALRLYETAESWLRAVESDGTVRFYLVPAAGADREYWRVTAESCSCPDATFRAVTCKHQWAVRLHEAAERERAEKTRRRPARVAGGKRVA